MVEHGGVRGRGLAVVACSSSEVELGSEMPEPAARAAVAMWAMGQAAVAIAADQAADHRQGAQSRDALLMSALAAFSMLANDSGSTPQGTFCGSSHEQT